MGESVEDFCGIALALLRRDFVQGIVGGRVENWQAGGGFHAVEVQFVDVSFRQFIEGQADGLVVAV